mmetsp:Transcript_11710/g.11343  ORF Transcript_11710/g.11343 Transcript_11710/m.11343 type:complete len:194 (-) Transcript_11710:1085-1666(-)
MKAFSKVFKKNLLKASDVYDKIFAVTCLEDVQSVSILGKKYPHGIKFRGWETVSDETYGGTSSCSHEVTEIIKFKGIIKSHERGFCALKGELKCGDDPAGIDDEGINLRDLEGFELELKCNTPFYVTMNMTNSSLLQGDLFQYEFLVQDFWQTYQIGFDQFRLTHNGKEKLHQRLNDSLQLESIGFLMTTPEG